MYRLNALLPRLGHPLAPAGEVATRSELASTSATTATDSLASFSTTQPLGEPLLGASSGCLIDIQTILTYILAVS